MDDRYDVDEDNMFQTTFSESQFSQRFGDDPAPAKLKNSVEQVSESLNLANESVATIIQEAKPSGIVHEGDSANLSKSLEPLEPFAPDKSLGLSQEEKKQDIDQVLNEISRQDSFKNELLSNKTPSIDMTLENVDLDSQLKIEVVGPRWVQDNVIYQGHYEFSVQSHRTGPSKLSFLSDQVITEVERRYSDFDLFRQALCCEYPGFFVPQLPPKETFLSFKQEDSDSLTLRKTGIKNFLSTIASHQHLSREENQTLSNFLSCRSSHQFAAFKQRLTQIVDLYGFIGQYSSSRRLAPVSNTVRTVQDFVAGAAFSLQRGLMSLTGSQDEKSVSEAKSRSRRGSFSDNQTFGQFLEPMEDECKEFAQFESYVKTLFDLQVEITGELEQYQLNQSQQASNYERLSEAFTLLRKIKPVDQGNKERVEQAALNSSGNLSMQMDSIDRGGNSSAAHMTAQFAQLNLSRQSVGFGDTTGYNELVEEISQTFTSLRDQKRKEALDTVASLVESARVLSSATQSAHEAVQRYRAIVRKKFETMNLVRQLRDQGSQQRAQNDAELIKNEELHKQLVGLQEQCRLQIRTEIASFKADKTQQTKKLVSLFQQAQLALAKQVQKTWQANAKEQEHLAEQIPGLR